MRSVNIPMEELAKLLQMQLDNGGRATLTVTGVSMLPMLRDRRDSVELITATQPPKKGDLILYRRVNGQYVLHRIIRADAEEFICCGDNQWEQESVAASQMVAVVQGFSRAGKSYTVTHMSYRLYVWLWTGLFPVRRPLIALRRMLSRWRRMLRRFYADKRL